MTLIPLVYFDDMIKINYLDERERETKLQSHHISNLANLDSCFIAWHLQGCPNNDLTLDWCLCVSV